MNFVLLYNVFVFIILKINFCRALAKSHPISTLINAKFSITPIQLEISEFLSDEKLFWPYVDEFLNLKVPLYELENDQDRYKKSLDIAGKFLTQAQIKLLKLSLSLASLTPRIQSSLQIANEILSHGNCGNSTSFVMCGDEIICDLKELKGKLKQKKSLKCDSVELYSFDHIYPGTENNSLIFTLYGEIGSKSFNKLHKVLKSEGDSGNIKYIVRHFVKNQNAPPTRLSGYGVELHIKSTEYKSQDDSPHKDDEVKEDDNNMENEVEGFNFKVLKERYPHLAHSLDRMRSGLLEKTEEIPVLKAWEFQELGLQAGERIAAIQGEEALQILQFTAQNFPTQAKSLLGTPISEDFRREMKHNIEVLGRNLNLQPPDAALFLNGMYFDAEILDIETLLEHLRNEIRVLEGLNKIGLKGKMSAPLLALDFSSQNKEFAIDVRDSSIIWINDLETDKEYFSRFGSSVMDLLRPTFPGMMRNVRKNFYNLVIVFDPIKPKARDVVRLAETFVVNMAPIRLGLVFDTRSGVGKSDVLYRSVNCAFNYMHQKKNAREALNFLTDLFASSDKNGDITMETLQKIFSKSNSKLSSDEVNDVLGEDSDFDYGRKLSDEFIERLGVKETPQILLNGVLMTDKALSRDEFEELILTEIMQQTPTLQKAIYRGDLTDSDNVLDWLMSQPNVMLRLNQRILSTDETYPVNHLDVNTGKAFADIEDVQSLAQLPNNDLTATLIKHLKYFGAKHSEENFLKNKLSFVSIWVVGDLNTESGKQLLRHGLEYMKSTTGSRLTFIPNADKSDAIHKNSRDLNTIVWATLNTLEPKEATEKVLRLLEADDFQQVGLGDGIRGFLAAAETHLKMLRVYCQRVLGFKSGENGVIANGRIYGPFNSNEFFSQDDFNLLEKINQQQSIEKVKEALKSAIGEEDEISIDSDVIFKLVGLLLPRQSTKNRFTIPKELKEDFTVVKLLPKLKDDPYFDVVAILDPASKGAQKLAPLLILLRQVVNCNLKVFLCAIDKHSDLPVKNFYRYVVEPDIQFKSDGKRVPGPVAKFNGMPANPLLTQNLHIPENWMVNVIRSVYDLDNIKLADIGGPVHSEYELEYLLLEGHCFDTTIGSPPRGLQFTLGTKDNPVIVDTIVMANLGYFQLKANPGAWILKLRAGKSSEIYDINSVDGLNTIHSVDDGKVSVVINSFKSHVLKVKVSKKMEKLGEDLLGEDENNGGIWDSITSTFSGSSETTLETINIFSVASGHLYERLLRIMMLSLLKHTKNPVKFWFLKNYLSPQFKDFLPHMSKEYNFEYELVQYKWPRWLHQQTEKQRTIWGYKILFLDSLFPLDVKKIIFVDADQIVRADIKELYNFDLGGAPYGYTPFCDSRKEMDGFRFWKSGYWRNHLQGRKYHISALYVVDLKRFRKIAAGDRLRGQYQALSQDPNSLSNLDQDLPNNMIHQVAIKSLPQEWLWCETWCSTAELKQAKTIDLCNNPQTKEAKLTAAQRIVPEWKDYDNEIKNLMTKVLEAEHEENNSEGNTGAHKSKHEEL